PKKKKKKKRRLAVEAAPLPPPTPGANWTNAHLAGALAVGLALGGLGGYAKWGQGAGSGAPIDKDSAAAPQGAARGAPSSQAARPQPPQEPSAPVYIALASYSPREGPEH